MSDDPVERVWSMVAEIPICMMTTHDQLNIRARPMVGEIDREAGVIWFFTRADAHKTDEVYKFPDTNVTFADAKSYTFVSMSGPAKLWQDAAMLKTLWNPLADSWFPEGPEDDNVTLIRFEPIMAEYWDAPSNKMEIAWEIVKSKVTGDSPDLGENRKVQFDTE